MRVTWEPAVKRYTVRVAVFMSAYLIILLAVNWVFKTTSPSGWVAFTLAIAPALPLIGVVASVMRLIADMEDEYRRMLLIRQVLFATGFCLTIVTIWQWLSNFDLVPVNNGGFGAAFFWFIGLGLGPIFNRITMGDWG